MNTLGMPHFCTKRSALASMSGNCESGHMCSICALNLWPNQYDSQSPQAAPNEAATQIGQKLTPLTPINAPIATSIPHAGISREITASDSANANVKTTGMAHT